MKRCKLIAAGLMLSASFITPAHAGIPTVDAAALANMVLQYQQIVQQLTTLKQTLETTKNQLKNAKQQLKAIEESRGFGDIASNLKNHYRSALPNSAAELLNQTTGSALGSAVKSIQDEVKAPVNFKEDTVKLAEKKLKIEATSKAMSQQAYDAMTRRLKDIDGLQQKINATTNPKEIAELQARIQIEQNNITAEQFRMQLAQQQLEAEKELLKARTDQVFSGWFGGQ